MPTFEITIANPGVTTLETKTVTAEGFDFDGSFVTFADAEGDVILAIRQFTVRAIERVNDPQPGTDIKRVLEALNEVVAEFGEDYVYERRNQNNHLGMSGRCVYVHNGAPDCLAGKVLRKLGLTLEQLSQQEGNGCTNFSAYFSRDVLSVLRAAQEQQDTGATWGVARDKAFELASSYYSVTLD